MGSLLFVGALIALVAMLLGQSPSADPSASDRRANWPRQAGLLAASTGAAFLLGREGLEAWFANSDSGVSAFKVDFGWFAIPLLAAAAVLVFRTFLPSVTPYRVASMEGISLAHPPSPGQRIQDALNG